MKASHRWGLVPVLFGLGSAWPSVLRAQETEPAAGAPQLEPRLRLSSGPRTTTEPAAAAGAEASPTPAPGRRTQSTASPLDYSPWQAEPRFRLGAYVHTLYVHQSQREGPSHDLRLRNARVQFEWSQGELLEAQIDVELAEEERAISAWAPVRDAFVRVDPLQSRVRLRVGQFKKPFSALELISSRELPLIERGLSNRWIVEDLRYGERDLGAQLDGRLGKLPRVSYALGVFNGSGRNQPEDDLDGSKDVVARVESDVVDWLSVGVSGSYKRFDRRVHPDYPSHEGVMGEIDCSLQLGGLRVLGEGTFGNNYLSRDQAESWSVLLLATYWLPLSRTWDLGLEPLVKGEILKAEDHILDAHIWGATLGANLHFTRHLRLMVQADMIRPEDNTPPLWEDRDRLLVQVAVRGP